MQIAFVRSVIAASISASSISSVRGLGLEDFRRRFEAQLKGAPDPQAPLNKEGKQKYYFRFDNFIRAMIYQELKSSN